MELTERGRKRAEEHLPELPRFFQVRVNPPGLTVKPEDMAAILTQLATLTPMK